MPTPAQSEFLTILNSATTGLATVDPKLIDVLQTIIREAVHAELTVMMKAPPNLIAIDIPPSAGTIGLDRTVTPNPDFGRPPRLSISSTLTEPKPKPIKK